MQLVDLRKELSVLRSDLAARRKELKDFMDQEEENLQDPYTQLMLPFFRECEQHVSRQWDQLQQVERIYHDTIKFFGEGPAPRPGAQVIPSEEFFGIFREFVIAYRKCQRENVKLDEAKRLQQRLQDAQRERARELAEAQSRRAAGVDDEHVLEDLIRSLHQSSILSTRRTRERGQRGVSNGSHTSHSTTGPGVGTHGSPTLAQGQGNGQGEGQAGSQPTSQPAALIQGDPEDIAAQLLAELNPDVPPTQVTHHFPRTTRRRPRHASGNHVGGAGSHAGSAGSETRGGMSHARRASRPSWPRAESDMDHTDHTDPSVEQAGKTPGFTGRADVEGGDTTEELREEKLEEGRTDGSDWSRASPTPTTPTPARASSRRPTTPRSAPGSSPFTAPSTLGVTPVPVTPPTRLPQSQGESRHNRGNSLSTAGSLSPTSISGPAEAFGEMEEEDPAERGSVHSGSHSVAPTHKPERPERHHQRGMSVVLSTTLPGTETGPFASWDREGSDPRSNSVGPVRPPRARSSLPQAWIQAETDPALAGTTRESKAVPETVPNPASKGVEGVHAHTPDPSEPGPTLQVESGLEAEQGDDPDVAFDASLPRLDGQPRNDDQQEGGLDKGEKLEGEEDVVGDRTVAPSARFPPVTSASATDCSASENKVLPDESCFEWFDPDRSTFATS